jgi:hypothetical protein
MHVCRYEAGGKVEEADVDIEQLEAEIKRIEDEMGPEEREQYEDLKKKLDRDDIPWDSPYDAVRLCSPCTCQMLSLWGPPFVHKLRLCAVCY